MSAFSPSPQFTKRWQATPVAVRRAFHQELEDIITMLKGENAASMQDFNHENFGQTLTDLFLIHKDETRAPSKFIYNLDNANSFAPTNKQNNTFADGDLDALEAKITQKITTQIDDYLSEHMAELSDNLKEWLKTAVKNELINYRQNSQ